MHVHSLLFDATCDLLSLAKEIDQVMKSVLSEHTIEQYQLELAPPVPEMEAAQLGRHIRNMATE